MREESVLGEACFDLMGIRGLAMNNEFLGQDKKLVKTENAITWTFAQ